MDTRFVDIDFAVQGRPTGDLGGRLPLDANNFADAIRTMSRDELEAVATDPSYTGCESLITRIFDQNGDVSCFPPQTLIRMADGTQRPIQDVKVTEKVLTAEGRKGTVIRVIARKATELVALRLRGHKALRATAEHKILTQRGYVPISELKRQDMVAIPRYVGVQSETFIQTAEFVPHRNRVNHKVGTRRLGIPGKAAITIIRKPVPDVIHLTERFGRLIGLFLAEGNTTHTGVHWTFAAHEETTLAQEVIDILDELGMPTSKRKRGNSTISISAYGIQWAKMFEELCATGSRHKRLHPALLVGPLGFLRSVMSAWLDGDLSRERKSAREGITISKQLAFNMFDIANAIGLRPYIRYRDMKPSKGVKTRQRAWIVGYGHHEADKKLGFQAPQDDTHLWRPVWDLRTEAYDGWVYDLEVEGDHSYVAEGLGVHNCTSNGTSQAHQIIQAVQFGKENVVQLSQLSLYKRVGTARSGSSVSGNLKEMLERGILPLDTEENRAKYKHVGPEAGYGRYRLPEGWEATALKFRGFEFYDIRGMDQFYTALALSLPVVYGRSGHAICAVRLMFDNGKFIRKYANSWGKWGDGGGDFAYGFGYDSERSGGASWAYALRAVELTDDQAPI